MFIPTEQHRIDQPSEAEETGARLNGRFADEVIPHTPTSLATRSD